MLTFDTLLQPFKLNEKIGLKNKIIMAPMTRDMANDNLSPNAQMVAYYARRADVGLIITEGTIIHETTIGFKNVPGIYTQKHIDGWKAVTDAVHERDGKIFLQIWHLGRVSHPHYLKGQLPLAPSQTMMSGRVFRSENLQFGLSREALLDEIKQIIEYYAKAAQNAMNAGFDGVEIHGANGYLIDQFLHYHTNHRTDAYGGNPENMARFPLEVVNAVGDTIGYEKTGIRFSPGAYLNQIEGDMRDGPVFEFLLSALNHLPIAYVHTGNFSDADIFAELNNQTMTAFMRAHYKNHLIACGGYSLQEAQNRIQHKEFDLIAIGRMLLANPDLISRITQGEALRPYDDSLLDTLY